MASHGGSPRVRGDFTADRRLIGISLLALGIGALCALVAAALLGLIALFTNLFYFHRLSFAAASPAHHTLGPWAVAVPIAGGLAIGLLARHGSDRIRGHGIPEALEAILIGRSRMDPKVAVLKPLSSAISIGSGGPFGAEGPIIMTGGACGSLLAQLFHLSAAERKTLLVAGAAGGMSATFATPIAAVLLAVELLLFEWKPRSLVPVALASVVAAGLRPHLLGAGPLFPLPPHADLSGVGLAACSLLGLAAGLAAALLTWTVYAAEDAFHRLPIHWMWWPAIGGVFVGLGGLLEPRALGVGYDVIRSTLLNQDAAPQLARLLLVKASIWAIALGSGTSGGVLAPLLIVGSSLGVLLGPVLPGGGHALWPLVGMAAILGGTMRAPLTAVVFALELSHDVHALLPLLLASVVAYALTVLVMPRSILTEKVARRGHHLSREYSVDPMDSLLVRDIASAPAIAVPAGMALATLGHDYFGPHRAHRHQGYPVIDDAGLLVGVVTSSELLDPPTAPAGELVTVAALIERSPIVAFDDETCREAAERMAECGVGRLPVVRRDAPRRLVGIITRSDLLKPRARAAELEQLREGVVPLPDGAFWRAHVDS
jgi:H+/Cl- antiporter ClcA/CBS domain-containing protein